MTLPKTQFQEYLRGIGACLEAREWAGEKTAREAWEACDRPDWLLWWAEKEGVPKVHFVQCAIAFARSVVHLVPQGETRPLRAIEAAEKWVLDPSEENRTAARAAAWEAWAEARAAAWAAEAAWAAAWEAAAAARAAAWAAEAAWAARARTETELKAVKKEQCAIIRSIINLPWEEN